MLQVRRFSSFEEINDAWIQLEEKTTHYPFQSFWYQQLFAQEFCREKGLYLLGVYEEETLLAIGGFEKQENSVLLLGMKQVLGGQDLTDYGDLLLHASVSRAKAAAIWDAVLDFFHQEKIPTLQLDFVREDSLTYEFFAGLDPKGDVPVGGGAVFLPSSRDRSDQVIITKQEVAPYIVVPSSWDVYLQTMSRKDRHELKRKIRRFEEQHAFHFCSDDTIHDDFENFIRLHRLSDTAKEQFMSEKMKQFFWDIVSAEKKDYRIDFCFLEMENKKVASVMSLIGEGKALLYNSGFDPAYSYFSVGLILHSYLVKKSIEEGLAVHDFLRGNERYKYDLGAKDMQLYRIVIDIDVI